MLVRDKTAQQHLTAAWHDLSAKTNVQPRQDTDVEAQVSTPSVPEVADANEMARNGLASVAQIQREAAALNAYTLTQARYLGAQRDGDQAGMARQAKLMPKLLEIASDAAYSAARSRSVADKLILREMERRQAGAKQKTGGWSEALPNLGNISASDLAPEVRDEMKNAGMETQGTPQLLRDLNALKPADIDAGIAALRAQVKADSESVNGPQPPDLAKLEREKLKVQQLSQAPRTAEADVIILRDRSRRPGKLEICGISACLVARTVVPRSQTEWIGLNLRQQVQMLPPAPRDSAKDEVFLADGSVHGGALLSVLAGTVATVSGSYPRAQVRWVHLALSASKGFTGANDVTPPGTQTPNAPGPTTTNGGGGSKQTAPDAKSSGPTGGGTPGSGLWVGTVRDDETVTYTSPEPRVFHYASTMQVRLREVHGTPASIRGRSGTYYSVKLSHENTSVTDGYDGPACSGQASTKLSGNDTSGQIWYPAAAPGRAPREPEAAGYRLSQSGLGGSWKPCPNTTVFFGHFSDASIGFDLNSPVWSLPNQLGFDPGGYRYLSGGNSRMFGNYRQGKVIASGNQAGSIERKVEWDICRMGSRGCQPPEFPQNCRPGASNVAGCQAQREQLVEELKKLWGQYQQYQAQAAQNQRAYRTAVAACAAGDVAMKVATYLIGPAEGEAAKDEHSKEINEAREALKVLAEITQKMINGENPLTIAHSEDLKDLATLQGAVEAIGELGSLFQSITPERMREHMAECSTPLPESTYQAALSYISSLESMLELAPEVQTAVNNIRQVDIQCQDEQWQAYKDCVEDARCQQKDQSGCNRLKPGPDWPDAP
jgi:hypothetical protein